jgi:transposase
MENTHYIGLDVHKKTIDYCVKDGSGRVHAEAAIPDTRLGLDIWMKTLPQPWTAAMEATIFTAWIYDHLQPHAAAVKVAHPRMLRAVAAAKKKNDRIDAHKIADCLRCDFLPITYQELAVRHSCKNGESPGMLLDARFCWRGMNFLWRRK